MIFTQTHMTFDDFAVQVNALAVIPQSVREYALEVGKQTVDDDDRADIYRYLLSEVPRYESFEQQERQFEQDVAEAITSA